MITSEARGKHGRHFQVDKDIKDDIRRHINSIPRIESHYCRNNTSREFIEGGKTVVELHRDHVESLKKHNKSYANYLMYSRIFNGEFNISFFVPRKDQCEDCVSVEISSDENKENLREGYETHLPEKELSRKEKEKDKGNNSENFIVAVYDLQAVLQCPRGDVSSFYYTSKLNVFNLTVFELKSKEIECFLWDESEGHRGVCEIGSCILNYLESLEDRANATQTKMIDIMFYRDNCCGQHKNQFMFAMYVYAVQHYNFINSVPTNS
ncbi:hypothetical protein NQ314_015974 [Rhamnusium bicolor]|uniref:Uncharacterized protein n=1 Tax=Rhamnusium bicolor TaxID=1586634 RepID=A0AAV8WYG4_9CUCU|nr:hypothetical protein NQ314_015974 [Rhamnusium bicolor]